MSGGERMGKASNSYDEYREYGPYGLHGVDVGRRALGMLVEFIKPTPSLSERCMWDESDAWAFEEFRELDTGVKFIEPHPDVDGGDLGDLHRTFGRLRAALPLSEAEREWLWSPHRPSGPEPDRYIGVTAEVMSGGLLRVIQGRDLARRWWAWRRETDEFARQGGLAEARRALSSLAEGLLIEEQRPHEFGVIQARFMALDR